MPQYPITVEDYTTPTATDADYYLPDGDLAFHTYGFNDITLITHRESETGTCTFQPFFEFLFTPTNTWYPWLDAADATQIQGVIYANSEVDTSTPFHRFTVIKNISFDGTDANRDEAVNTVHRVFQAYFPPLIRVRFRVGGTSVSTRFSAMLSGS